MATATRRYVSALDFGELSRLVGAGAAPTGLSGAWIQIQYDDTAYDGVTETLDEYIAWTSRQEQVHYLRADQSSARSYSRWQQ